MHGQPSPKGPLIPWTLSLALRVILPSIDLSQQSALEPPRDPDRQGFGRFGR
jgi:hypothetical protein